MAVISGIPHRSLLSVIGVCVATRLSTFWDRAKEGSTSVCLTSEGELPDRLFLDYICFRVCPLE